MGSRTRVALILAVASVAAVCFLSQVEDQHETALQEISQMSTGFDEEDPLLAKAAESAVTGKAVDAESIHKHIVELKAYCVGVHQKVTDMYEHQTASIVPFILAFGKDAKTENIILEYSQTYAKLEERFTSGMGMYILKHMNKAMLAGDGVLTMLGKKYTFDFIALGFTHLPQYLKELTVSLSDYRYKYSEIEKLADNAEAKAASKFLKDKQDTAYTAFLERAQAKADASGVNPYRNVYDAAMKAEYAAYLHAVSVVPTNHRMHAAVQMPAGYAAAMATRAANKDRMGKTPDAETDAEIEKEAADAAKWFIRALTKNTATSAGLIDNLEQEALGVTLKLTTSDKLDAESSMEPTVKIVGSLGSVTAQIFAVPPPGETLMQQIPSDHPIGKLQSITITSDPLSKDPWQCKQLSARVGANLTFVEMAEQMFWLDADANVVHHGLFISKVAWTLSTGGPVESQIYVSPDEVVADDVTESVAPTKGIDASAPYPANATNLAATNADFADIFGHD